MSGRFTAILLLLSAVRYALGECDGEDGTCDVEEMAMLQSAKQSPGDCKCAEPNGDNNEILCLFVDSWGWGKHGNCPWGCQCSTDAIFNMNDIDAHCHGGKCGT